MKSNIIRRLTLLSPAILFSLSLPLTGLAEESAGDQSEPQTYARFVPERSDDFAWENDLIAFRAYGPALRDSSENSGFDCWLKRVDYPIVDKWYQQNSEGMSYHKDHGEGLDNYKVGDSAGCGGTGIWINGEREPLETFTEHEVIELTAERSQFKLSYERDIDGVIYGEEKIVTVEMGTRLFTVDSTFFKDGKPAADLPVCVGLLSNDGKGQHSSDKAQGWIAIWEELDDSELGTGRGLSITSWSNPCVSRGIRRWAVSSVLRTNSFSTGTALWRKPDSECTRLPMIRKACPTPYFPLSSRSRNP